MVEHVSGNFPKLSRFSGGPLQVANNEPHCTYTQIGLVSYGLKKCGTAGMPGGYVNVFHYLDWIENIVWNGEN